MTAWPSSGGREPPVDRVRAAGGAVMGALARAWSRLRRVRWEQVRDGARRVWRGRTARAVVVAAVGLAGGSLGLIVGGQVTTPIGPADVELSLRPAAAGETVVNVSPLGRLSLDTHQGPLRLEASITEIRLAAAERAFQDPAVITQMADRVTEEVNDGVAKLFVRAVLVGMAGAALTGVVVFRDWRRTAGSTLSAGVALVACGGLAAATFNPQAIVEPRYTGLLAGAPQAVGDAAAVVDRFEEYSEQLAGMVGNVSSLYQTTANLPVFEDSDEPAVRVLHVSDLHLNPAAWQIIRSLSEQFQVDFIVDSGDLTEAGTAPEETFAESIGGLETPYVWVRGDHDSDGTARAVAAQDNAVVLDGQTVELAGLRVYGVPDPRFGPQQATAPLTEDRLRRRGHRQAGALEAEWEQQREDAEGEEDDAGGETGPADLAVIHDPVQAEGFDGVVPLVLCGHGHEREVTRTEAGTMMLCQGSTGGAGLAEVAEDSAAAHQASVLYFDADTGRLQARDDIGIGELGLTTAQIARHVEPDPDRELGEPSPGSSPTEDPAADEEAGE